MVPGTGLVSAKRRAAASVLRDARVAVSGTASLKARLGGSFRKARASSNASLTVASPRLRRIRSRRSPCSRVAASTLCAVEHKTDYVALLVMLRRLRLRAFPQTVSRLARNIIFLATRCKRGCASIKTEARLCLKKFSFPEPLRDIEQRRL